MMGKATSTQMKEPLYELPNFMMNEPIVISGIGGRFPESENVEQLEYNLFNHVDMITEDDRRWKIGLSGVPRGGGKVPDLEHFDAWFFNVHGKMAAAMDPGQRLLLEVAYEAIFDAGLDPLGLEGRNVGVYIGSSGASVPEVMSDLDDLYTGYEALGNSPAMMANRTSYTFDVRGPSFTLDTGCSSSMFALNEALMAMRSGQCEAAVVAGCTLLKFNHTQQLSNTGILSPDSRCKAYDKSANGFVRSEAVAAVYLQKMSDAKRCYGTVLNCKGSNDGRKIQGIMFPSAPCQKDLISSAYEEIKMDPRNVAFLEAHGTGNPIGDKEEGKVISEVFCPYPEDVTLVTSTKSNLGHTEASSGVISLIKVCLAFERRVIPANLHFKSPNPEIKVLMEGRMKVVSENTPFEGGIVGISNFGFGGGNSHMIVESFDKEKPPAKGRRVPRLVTACGCTTAAVQHILDTVRNKEFTDEAIVLLEDACKTTPEKMRYRGYTLVSNQGPEEDVIQLCPPESRPVWFLYSGMGSQWPGMGKQMMKLVPFAKSIRDSAEILRPLGLDLIHLLTEATDEELNHILYPFVTIAAIQIALTDMLKSMGVHPNGIVGHSVGELGCAYADGTFTARQMLLAAYWRGKSCVLTQLIDGRMAAVGMTWEEAKSRCPTGVYPVCHNAQDSVTISGPTDKVETFVENLKRENVFARLVKTGDIAFHCKYVEPASVLMRKELEKVIPHPVARSPLWVSSSVPEVDWNKPRAQFSSVDYHINNLLSPVLFCEAMEKVPKDALIIEIAPHSLLKPIVKRILGPNAVYVGLCNRTKTDNLRHFLSSVGSLYANGLNPEAKNLYDPVTFPVPRGTAMLNSLIKWDRSHWPTWTMANSVHLKDMFTIDTYKGGPYEYITGHKIDGRVMYTGPGYVWLAWKCLSKILVDDLEDMPVVFEDLVLHRAAVLPKNGVFTFNVKLRVSDGTFDILESESLLCSGIIKRMSSNEQSSMSTKGISNDVRQESFTMDRESFYRELRLRGYEYSKLYQGVSSCQFDGSSSTVEWKGNWVMFIESVLHLAFMHTPSRALALLTRIRKIKLDPLKIPKKIGEEVRVTYNANLGRLSSEAIEVEGIELGVAPRRHLKNGKSALEQLTFLPFVDGSALTPREQTTLEEYSRVCSTVAARALRKFGRSAAILSGSLEANEDLVNRYLKGDDARHVLLDAFRKMESSGNLPNVDEQELARDLISTACMSERSMRACLDCFLENAGATKFNIVEISNRSVVYPEVDRSLRFTYYGHLVTNYTLARVGSSPIPGGLSPGANVLYLDDQKLNLPGGVDLIVAKDVFTTNALPVNATLSAIFRSLRDYGFAVLTERTGFAPAESCLASLTGARMLEQNEEVLERAFRDAGLDLICKKKDGKTFVTYLLRKIEGTGARKQLVFRIIEDTTYPWIEDLKVIMKQESESGAQETVWVVDDRPESGVYGLFQSISREVGGSKFRIYSNASLEMGQKIPKFDLSSAETREIVKKDLRVNCYRDGQWGTYVHQVLPKDLTPRDSNNCYLNTTERGDVTGLKWIETGPIKNSSQGVSVQVVFSGIDKRDAMLALGKIPPSFEKDPALRTDCKIGLEFAGVESGTGRRLIGLVPGRGVANTVTCQSALTLEVPTRMSLEEAATLPLAYLTAYYSLLCKGRLEIGESVLVHDGASTTGQAAITLTLARNCNVFATVGSAEKKSNLLSQFSELKACHVINTETENFEEVIMAFTSRRGVDVVLNFSLDTVRTSVRCLKFNGRFLDLGAEGSAKDQILEPSALSKNVEFHGITMATLLFPTNQRRLRTAMDMFREGLKNGEVKPLKRTVFKSNQIVEAFRSLDSGTNSDKLLIKIREEPSGCPLPTPLPAQSKLYFSPDKSAVVTGGFGGVGFELVIWLVERGVDKLVISSRSGPKNDYHRYWLYKWKQTGVQVVLCHEDISTDTGCRALLTTAARLAPVGAIFHLAVVLRDGLLENMTPQDYVDVGNVKVIGSRNLDAHSRDLCPQLDYFMATSSILASKLVGGLGNYTYSNSSIERLCEIRHHLGLPAMAIGLGAIGDAGIYFDEFGGEDSTRHFDLRGTVLLVTATVLQVIERFLLEKKPVLTYFSHADEAEEGASSRKDLLSAMGNILGVPDTSTLRHDTTLGSLGMDSLMVVEAKQLLDSDYSVSLSIPQVLKLTIEELKNMSAAADKV